MSPSLLRETLEYSYVKILPGSLYFFGIIYLPLL